MGWLSRRLLVSAVAAGVIGGGLPALGLAAGMASASGTTRYVGASAGGNKNCGNPGYTSVQAAVNAASPGDTVYLCGSAAYREQVIVSKSLTLTGGPGATLAAPVTWTPSSDPLPPQFATDNLFQPEALVVVWGHHVNVTVKGLRISGPLPTNGGCANEEFGILVIDGANANLTKDKVNAIRDSNPALYGCQYGVGIQVGREYWPTADYATYDTEDFTGTAVISGTVVSGYQKGGIVVDGPGSGAWVRGSTVTGGGPGAPLGAATAQNGIQFSRGALGGITGTTVDRNQYTGAGNASATGILVFGGCGDPLTPNVLVRDNTLNSNDIGVALENYDPACATAPATRTGDSAIGNKIYNSAVTNISGYSTTPMCGYQAGVQDVGNDDVISGNAISGAGYANHPTCTPTQPYVTYRIDATGSIKTRNAAGSGQTRKRMALR